VRTGQQISPKYQFHKALITSPNIGNLDETKGTRYVLYSLIAVHEEAGDECAHAQLIADIFRLRYRDTSLSTSSETTQTLPKTESWVAAWLEFFFRSTLELLLVVGDEDGGQFARQGMELMGEMG
jgi:hypothetical protein